jgi:hypothetical protein
MVDGSVLESFAAQQGYDQQRVVVTSGSSPKADWWPSTSEAVIATSNSPDPMSPQ